MADASRGRGGRQERGAPRGRGGSKQQPSRGAGQQQPQQRGTGSAQPSSTRGQERGGPGGGRRPFGGPPRGGPSRGGGPSSGVFGTVGGAGPEAASAPASLALAGFPAPTTERILPATVVPEGLAPSEMMTRPDTGGKEGRKLRARANFFQLAFKGTTDFHQYDVVIRASPKPPKNQPGKPCTNRTLNRAVFKTWQEVQQRAGGVLAGSRGKKVWCTFVGMKVLFASSDLGARHEVNVDGVREPDSDETSSFILTLQKSTIVPIAPLLAFQKNPRQVSAPGQDLLNALDLLLRQAAPLIPIGRSLFDPEARMKVERSAMMMMRGVYGSARLTQSGVAVNVDVANALMFPGGPLLDAIKNHLNLPQPPATLDQNQRASFLAKFRGVLFKVTHRGLKSGRYRLRGFSTQDANQLTFDIDGKRTSAVEYYQSHYNKTLQYPRLPLAEVRTSSPTGEKITHFPLEFCTLVPNQRFPGRLEEPEASSLVRFATSKPNEREAKVVEGRGKLELGGNEYLDAWGVGVGERLVQVDARRIDGPKIRYKAKGGSGNRVVDPEGKGVWFLPDNGGYVEGKTIDSLGVLCLADPFATCSSRQPQDRERNIRTFVDKLLAAARLVGMTVAVNVKAQYTPIVFAGQRDPIPQALANLRQQMAQGNSKLALVVLPTDTSNNNSYRDVKRAAETVIGLPTQCFKPKWIKGVEESAFKKTDRTLFNNLLLKINAKLGGVNAAIESPLPVVSEAPTMLVGIDVTHPAPGSTAPSIAAVVASMDRTCTKYRAAVLLQEPRVEALGRLDECMLDHLRLFQLRNGRLPERIVVYRDGVSESQFQAVLEGEVSRIRAAVNRIDQARRQQGLAGYTPKISFIVVQKRHHTRFFFDSKDADKNGNAQPGTVVDTGIVSPSAFEYYVYSHAGLIGTSRPTKYQVLLDDSNLGSDRLQKLTYHLCYTWARSQRSVSVPPPAYYAHCVADRARCHVDGEGAEAGILLVRDELRNSTMWFV